MQQWGGRSVLESATSQRKVNNSTTSPWQTSKAVSMATAADCGKTRDMLSTYFWSSRTRSNICSFPLLHPPWRIEFALFWDKIYGWRCSSDLDQNVCSGNFHPFTIRLLGLVWLLRHFRYFIKLGSEKVFLKCNYSVEDCFKMSRGVACHRPRFYEHARACENIATTSRYRWTFHQQTLLSSILKSIFPNSFIAQTSQRSALNLHER